MKTGAFFDIDGTLYRNSLMIEHFKKLIRYEVLNPSIWYSHVKKTFDAWEKREGEFDAYMTELAEIYIDSLKGQNMEHLDFIANQVIDLKGDKVYSFTRDRIEWHKKQGHKIFFISGSPDHLVSKMAEKYGVTDFRATEYIKNSKGTFTGEVVPMWDSDSKDVAIDELVKKYDIDIKSSYAYGDTNGDFSMLKLVDNPVAINPSNELVKHIKKDTELRKKATIIVERKDVIYKLDSTVEILNL